MKAMARIVLCSAVSLVSMVGCGRKPAAAELPFTWTTNADNTITISEYIGTNLSVTGVIIPDRINGLSVTTIGECVCWQYQRYHLLPPRHYWMGQGIRRQTDSGMETRGTDQWRRCGGDEVTRCDLS